MDLKAWLGALAIGLIAGLIAGRTVSRAHGLLANLFIGVIGAGLGGWLGSIFALPLPALLGASAAGAILVLALLSAMGRAR
ncbi:MAG: GlsB/YeaQ/YmgE family stress response membrane protein [Caulobacteraceae bacterium]